ncbi:MAG TPA: hypothetical protein VHJ20_12615 [Polyangia bacterium]|nr:hypothetical protein [Polyangia bacterium]
MRGRWRGLLVGVLLATVGACGQAASSCPDDEPAACPSPAPSFSGQVQDIFARKCDACHAPGGVESSKPFVTYAQISPRDTRLSIESRIVSCNMPQAGAPQLTEDERLALLGWLVCGGPNN